MDVSVLIPWRPGDEHREAALRWVTDRYAATYPEWQIILGTAPDGPWCKALAVADGLERCDNPLIAIGDADVWCDTVHDAVTQAQTHGWAMPHKHVHRLTQDATAAVLAGGPLEGKTTERPYWGWPGGGIVAVTREAYDAAPIDPRFVGWGHEDESWAAALRCIVGEGWRGLTPLWHLWHPPQPRLSRGTGSKASAALAHRYRVGHKPASLMTDLIGEAKAWHQPLSESPSTAPTSAAP